MNKDNDFLSNYTQDKDKAAPEAPKTDAQETAGYKYEEKSGFVKPEKRASAPSARKSPKLTGPIIAGALVIVAAIITMVVLLNQGVKVIDLTGWEVNDAFLWADEKGVMLQVEEAYNDTYDTGVVYAQNVSVGEKVKKGDFIKINVSLGHDLTVTLPLPDIMSMTVDEVEAWSEQNYMTKVRITSEYSDTVPLGNVIRYEINDSTVVDLVRRDTPIYVIVSKGVEDESAIQVEVPDFRTMTLGACYAFANENGIVLTVEEQYDEYVPKGSIISQSVKAEKKVNKGEEIKLIVSQGKMITIPDFSQYSKEMASTIASQLGIPITLTDWYSGSSTGTFLSQSIKADTVYQEGDVIELKYSLGNQINMPSFMGQTQGSMKEWVNELNEKGANIKLDITFSQSSSDVGTIIYQDKAGMMIGPNETIHITVSEGRLIYTPDFVGLGNSYEDAVTREMAIEMCEALNIIPNFVEAHHSGYLPGEIWHQSIPAGTEIAEGTVITLKYRPVTSNNWTDVPDFEDKTENEARAYLDKLNITFEYTEGTSKGSGGVVIAQSIAENTRVAYGTKITLTIAPPAAPTYALSIAVDPIGAGTTTGMGTHPEGSVAITATANTGYVFDRWDGADVAKVDDPSAANTSVTLDADISITAVFVVAP